MSERDLFTAACAVSDPAERAAFLDEACAGDAELRRRLEVLLRAHDQPDSLLDAPVVVPPTADHDPTRAFGENGQVPQDALSRTEGEAPADHDDALGFLGPPGRPDSLGRLGHYEVLEVLGRGGFGIVFRAFDDILQRVVAVKVLAPSLAATSPARKRFLREARSAAPIQHENVVRIHETGEEPLPFLVMEFVPGETLQHRLDRTGPLDVVEVIRIGRQIAAGLAAAHEQGLIHRDIKPSNILIDSGPQAQVKLTDFGLARAADDASLTRSGVIAGTPMYMAPEQAKGDTLDHRADLFSLGSVLYVMCTGRPPFRATGTMAVLKRVCEDEPRPIRAVIPEVPRWLCNIVEKLHAKDPADRFAHAREVADLLADCEAQLKASGTLTDFSRIPGGRSRSSRRGWTKAAAVATLFLAAGLGLVLTTGMIPALTGWIRSFGSGRTEETNPTPAVLSLRLDDVQVRYRIDGHGAEQTGVSVVQLPMEPGRHRLWFALGPRQFETAPFDLAPGQRAELSLEAKSTAGKALLNGKPLDVRPLNPKGPDAGWVQLFNGKDLKGWHQHPDEPGTWVVEEGRLVGKSGRPGYLFTDRGDFENFHLRAEVKLGPGGDSGIFFRTSERPMIEGPKYPGKKSPPGYEMQLCNDASPHRTGSLMLVREGLEPFLTREERRLMEPDRWAVVEIVAEGPWLTVTVAGETLAKVKNEAYARGHLALQMWNDRTDVSFRKIEFRELPKNAAPSVAQAPFVVLAGNSATERVAVADLQDAVAAAQAGDIIEIRADGPFEISRLQVDRPLTLRAGEGFRPVLEHDRRDGFGAFLLSAKGGLVLEGLTLTDTVGFGPGRRRGLVEVADGLFLAAHCRFLSAQGLCRTTRAPFVEVRQCEFLSAWNMAAALDWSELPSQGRLRMTHCVTPNWALFLNPGPEPLRDADIALSNNTLLGRYLLSCWSGGELLGDGKAPAPFLVTATDNLLLNEHLFRVEIDPRRTKLNEWPMERVDRLARALFAWKGRGNVVRPDAGYELWHAGAAKKLVRSTKGRDQWLAVWGKVDASIVAAEGELHPVRKKLASAFTEVSAADFRLGKDSPGKGAGPGGRDPGADVDQVGPGEPYHRWRRTEDYREWRRRIEDALKR